MGNDQERTVFRHRAVYQARLTNWFTVSVLSIVSLAIAAFVLTTIPAAGKDFVGTVISILDGDTIEVLHNARPERIRLNGIDCPEKGQPHGKKAKHAAAQLVFGKKVTLHTFGKGKYGRTIADVLLPDGTRVNYKLVKMVGGRSEL